jgi:hypothetical protein
MFLFVKPVNGSKALGEVWAVESEVSFPQPIYLLTDTRLTIFKFSIHNRNPAVKKGWPILCSVGLLFQRVLQDNL